MSDADLRIEAINSIKRMADLLARQRRILNDMQATLTEQQSAEPVTVAEPVRCRHCMQHSCHCSHTAHDDWQAELKRARDIAKGF